jgi:uncharacterized protein YbjT (DUF2867 family)
MTTLITGAAGKTGRAIIRALARRGRAVRAFVHSEAQAAHVREAGALEVVSGDMQDATAFRGAAQGTVAIYHIAPNVSPDEFAIGRAAIKAARSARAGRFVYHSVLHPQVEAMPHHWLKMHVEELLFMSGLRFTILQPVAYMQNILAGWAAITEQGRYRVPYPVTTRLGMVDLEDVAEAAAIVLTEDGHAGAIYELAGPDTPTQIEVAAILAHTLGRDVHAEEISLEAWEAGARGAGLGAYQIATLLAMFSYYDRYGFWGNPNVLGWLLGRPPTSFRDFAERAAQE